MTGVSLQAVSKRFGESWAVRDLNLDITRGEFVSVVGGSGCGKTTTLRMIAGFETPTSGEITISGQSMAGVPVQDRGVGIVFQSYALFPTMTVAQNIAFGLEMAKKPAIQRQERVREMLDLVHLTPLQDRYPWQLSGGQQQRVALARALAVAPRVLLLDEPLSALDARIRITLRAEIRRIQRELNLTAIYVTHDQEEALTIADHIVVMDKGQIRQVGTARDIYDTPESPFVADFVGVSTRLDGVVEHGVLKMAGLHLPLPPERITSDGPAQVYLRPERLHLSPGATDTCISATLGVVTFLGATWRVQVWLKDGPSLLVDVPRQQDTWLLSLRQGDRVFIPIIPADLHVYVTT